MKITPELRKENIEMLGLRLEDDVEGTERLMTHALYVVGGFADEESSWAIEHAGFYADELDRFIGQKCLQEQDGCEDRIDRVRSSISYVWYALHRWVGEAANIEVEDLREELLEVIKAARAIERYMTYDGGADEEMTCAHMMDTFNGDLLAELLAEVDA